MDTSTLILNSAKFNKVEDLVFSLDLISDLIKEDIQKICRAKSLFFSDFEASFKVALNQTKNTIKKKNLTGVKRFFSCTNLKEALKWLQARIINNMINASNIKHNFGFKAPIFGSLEDYNISKSYDIDKEIEIEKMMKMDKEEIKKGLKKVWEEGKYDPDFDLQDLQDLCEKYNVNLYDVVDKKELELPNIGTYKLNNGLKQTFFLYEEGGA